MSTITEQILALQSLSVAELTDRYANLFGKPPRVRNKAFLQRRVAWKIQELEFGGLSDQANQRLDELIADVKLPLGDPGAAQRRRIERKGSSAPLVGTTLVRRWHDQEIRVEVRENGFEWDGTLYRSLSAVARAVTGSAWNGRLFFGLTQRRTKA